MRKVPALLATLLPVSLFAGPNRASGAELPWSFKIGGELRERFEETHNPVFGLASATRNDYLLQRAMLSGEARQGDSLRAVVELASGVTSGWEGSPPPTQKNPLDLRQAFLEKSLPVAGGRMLVRAGRQELTLGSARLVSVRESPNIRRSFDGVRASWTSSGQHTVNAFFVRPVSPETGAFDDRSHSGERFWGLYATGPAPGVEPLHFDSYYLGLDRTDAEFAQGEAREIRHTVGARAFGELNNWEWNIEAAWQWGSFGDSTIRAWTASMDIGFEFSELPLSPRIGLKLDAISGDENLQDRRLGTFNPLFPRLPYFSEANLATPANLLDAQPSLSLSLTSQLDMTLSWDGLRKHRRADAFYAPPLSPVAGTSNSESRDIGWQASARIEWQATEQIEVASTYVAFEPSSELRELGGRSGSFFAMWLKWSF